MEPGTNKKNNGYTMTGHTLPGINQRSDATAATVAEQGLAGSSAFQTNGVVGMTPLGVTPTKQPPVVPMNPAAPTPPSILAGVPFKPSMAKNMPHKPNGIPPSKAAMMNQRHVEAEHPHKPLPGAAPKSKPSMAKDKVYRRMDLPENKNHNEKRATASHHGPPHGPWPPAAPKSKTING